MFEKKVKVYEAKGKKAEFRKVRDALKEAGFRKISTTIWQDEAPVCGCGAHLDARDFGSKGRIDRDIYTIRVPARDAGKADLLVREIVPGYQPYQPSQRQFHMI